MSLKFKNRIALFNTLAVAFTTALVFLLIYFVVNKTAYDHLDENISHEKEEVLSNLMWFQDSIVINKMPEFDEAEHSQVEVNPTFLQVSNHEGRIIFQSANLLKGQSLSSPSNETLTYYNSKLVGQRIRLGQFPIINGKGEEIGRLTIAVSEQQSYAILTNLIWILLLSFPFVLIVQFLTSSLAASRSIKPVHQLIDSASGIGDSNISSRLPLPERQDELYDLSITINELLARIEKSMLQQKQFTSDASHEIRTPLSAIRGTLEVLIRKQREPKAYEEKISGIIAQVDRLDALLEQLLQLARVESDKAISRSENINLSHLISAMQEKWLKDTEAKNISLHIQVAENANVPADKLFLELILDNLINNAIKYGKERGNVFLSWDASSKTLLVKDDGIGISAEHLPNIFNRFYRADESRSSLIRGNGLGLSIVKKLADLQNIILSVESQPGAGSIFTLQFPY